MNLSVSYNWLKEYVQTKDSPAELARKLTISGPTVDFIREVKPAFKQVITGEITSLEPHPNADKLQVCRVAVGKAKPLTIVCGATNIKPGQKVPVVLVGGEVPGLEVKKAKIRGVESEGMLCSQKELGIGEDHSGIFILPEYTKVGLPLEKVMPFEDFIFDIEVTSNRPDAMSIIGIAREAAAISGSKFLYQEPKPNLKIGANTLKLEVTVKEAKLCPRYQAVVMGGIKVASSPLWMQQRLLAAGLRPINNLVDITNYVLLEFGQPMHVFDYYKLKGGEINVRQAKAGEKILALDGKNYELPENALVIADRQAPVAIAGVMGGELSAAGEATETIVLEAATFDPLTIRQTARILNLHSESSNLFEKGLSPENTTPALARAIELVMELAGGQVASKIFDQANYVTKTKELSVSEADVARVLGVAIKPAKIKSILENLGFSVSGSKELKVKAPWWRRADIEGVHDLIEEVARVYGYHQLPAKLMTGEIPVAESSRSRFALEDKIKDIIVGLGYSENINYSFISEKMIKNASLAIKDHLRIANPLSGDFEYLRISLAPGIIQALKENERLFPTIKIFELSQVYLPRKKDLPTEQTDLAIAVAGESSEEAFFEVKGVVAALLQQLNIPEYSVEPLRRDERYWSKEELAEILVGEKSIGKIGLINREILHLFGNKKPVALAEINFAALAELAQDRPIFQPIPKFPGIDLDISMEIDDKVLYRDVLAAIRGVNELIRQVWFLSVYRGERIPQSKKALAVRVHYRDDNKTLELTEAQAVHNQVVAKLKKEYNVTIR